jgi:hypothetical protein
MQNIIDSVPSPEFIPVSLARGYNRSCAGLSKKELGVETLTGDDLSLEGRNVIRGIPFDLGSADGNNVIFLKDEPVTVVFDRPVKCNYMVFIHTAVRKRAAPGRDGITHPSRGRVLLGDKAADYQLLYDDGSSVSVPIRRRFAVGEIFKDWGDECFEAVPMVKPLAVPTISELMSGGRSPGMLFGKSQTRVDIGKDDPEVPVNYWVYAHENAKPGQPVAGLRFVPAEGNSLLILGLSVTELKSNPLSWGRRQKILVTMPEGMGIGSPDDQGQYPGLGVDLGQIISVSPCIDYNNAEWKNSYNNKAPNRLENQYVVEYCAHPAARFTVGVKDRVSIAVKDLGDMTGKPDFPQLSPIDPAENIVNIRIIDSKSRNKIAVKLHIHGKSGEYLPPLDRHRIPNPYWFEDYSADYIANELHFCSYIDGEARVKLPRGDVYIEVSKGFEIKPVRDVYTITPQTDEIVIELERVLPWREKGWVSADTHVHFLSTGTALLEGAAEGVNVVNLLASQWGELFTNIADFDGRTTYGSREAGGDGEYLVRVGTENRQHVLGHISLCGYSGQMITPLTTGGPDESALGDGVEVTLSWWAEQCRERGGVVVLPHFPDPRCENAAAIVMDRIDAVEMTSWDNLYGGIDPYSVSDWYRYLNCGYFVAAVGGTDKMCAATAVGTVRTYALIEDNEFTYDSWKKAVRSGRTFVTYGPLLEFAVEGLPMGSRLELPESGGTLNAEWKVASVTVPVSKVELVVNGETREVVSVGADQSECRGYFSVPFDKSGWVALRVRGSYPDKTEMIAAHSSPVMVKLKEKEIFRAADAITILEQIEGAIAFIDTVATRAEAKAYKAVKMSLTSAHRAVHNRMHNAGVFHEHSPFNRHEHPDHKD